MLLFCLVLLRLQFHAAVFITNSMICLPQKVNSPFFMSEENKMPFEDGILSSSE